MAKIGYARTSATGQHLKLQVMKLQAFGCIEPHGIIFQEERHIPEVEDREQLKACLDVLNKGDALVVTKLDRLTRSTEKLAEIAKNLGRRGAALIVIDQNINTKTLKGKLRFKYCLLSRNF